MRAAALLLVGTCLMGCASRSSPPSPPHLLSPAPSPVEMRDARPIDLSPQVYRPKLLASTPVPNPPEGRGLRAQATTPTAQVARANAAARFQPNPTAFAQAAQIYPFADGGLYQVYAAPGQITDIVLQAGETLSATGPVAAGDTTRWIVGDTESGTGAERQVHILVKPTGAKLATNLVINTNRRTYHLELRATPATYMASVAWRYPLDEQRAAADAARATAVAPSASPDLAVEALNFGYQIDGDRTTWRPTRVFDDGRRTMIEFPQAVAQGDLPPLFIGSTPGQAGELVNYRVKGRMIIVDRLFDAAELRLGGGRDQKVVRISRSKERAS